MRVATDEIDFSSYLLRLGDGTEQVYSHIGQDMIQIPEEYLVSTMDDLIDKVFPNVGNGNADRYWIA